MTEPTRIDPADIRVGDRVERRYVDGDDETIDRFEVKATAHRSVSSCRLTWGIEAPRIGTAEWYLLDRPDPDAPLIERVAEAIYDSDERSDAWSSTSDSAKDAYRDNARAALAAIRETHDIVAKGGE